MPSREKGLGRDSSCPSQHNFCRLLCPTVAPRWAVACMKRVLAYHVASPATVISVWQTPRISSHLCLPARLRTCAPSPSLYRQIGYLPVRKTRPGPGHVTANANGEPAAHTPLRVSLGGEWTLGSWAAMGGDRPGPCWASDPEIVVVKTPDGVSRPHTAGQRRRQIPAAEGW